MTHDMRTVDELLAETAARADCTRRRVGAVIIRDSGLVVGIGWNGLTEDGASCTAGACPRGQLSYEEVPAAAPYAGNCAAEHAEVAAIRRAGTWAAGSTLYVTAEPCPWCAEACEKAGVKVVVRLQS